MVIVHDFKVYFAIFAHTDLSSMHAHIKLKAHYYILNHHKLNKNNKHSKRPIPA